MTTRPATVNWPPETTCECGDTATDEINGEPMCGTCYDEFTAGADHEALDQIAALLPDALMTPEILEIARIVQGTGRQIGNASATPHDPQN